MKLIKGDLVLKEDFKIDDNLKVEGNIRCVNGKWNINALDINALDINALDINALDINAGNINALDIICKSRKKKSKDNKTIAYSLVLDRFNREKKEQMPENAQKRTEGGKE